jgi:hypothetical protein
MHTNTYTHNNLKLKHMYLQHTLRTLEDNPQTMTTRASHTIAIEASHVREKLGHKARNKFMEIQLAHGEGKGITP